MVKQHKNTQQSHAMNSIRIRLNLVLGLLISLLLIIALTALQGMNTGQEAVTDILNGEGKIAQHAREAELSMLQARRAEKNYLLRFQDIGLKEARTLYLPRVAQRIAEVQQHLSSLNQLGVEVTAMQQKLNQYHTHFLEVVELYEQHGYIDSGLEGGFRQAAHALEEDIRTEHSQWLHLLLQLRRHEKDYLLRGDAQYIQRVQNSIKILNQTFQVLGSDQAYHQQNLDMYRDKFMQLVVINQKIAENIAIFQESIHHLAPELEKLVQRGHLSAKHTEQDMLHVASSGQNLVLTTALLALLLGIMASLWLSRSIIRPIQSVSQATKNFAQGDMDSRAVVTGPSELVELAQSFNHMADELQRSLHEMEQFSYAASHDLQEPLRMVASYTQLLAKRYEGKLDARADKYIHFAGDGAKRMQVLINDLLSYSRVGSKAIVMKPVESQTIVQHAIENLDHKIQKHDAEINVSQLPKISGDATLLTRVFQNIIANALKYRSDATPLIQIDAQKAGEMVRFSIRDNGLGIAPEFHQRIFVIFQRLHERGKYEGTGLGLAITKKIIEQHGGSISLTSAEGEGSTFIFSLPAA